MSKNVLQSIFFFCKGFEIDILGIWNNLNFDLFEYGSKDQLLIFSFITFYFCCKMQFVNLIVFENLKKKNQKLIVFEKLQT